MQPLFAAAFLLLASDNFDPHIECRMDLITRRGGNLELYEEPTS